MRRNLGYDRCVLHTTGCEEAGAKAFCKLEVSLLAALVLAGDVKYLEKQHGTGQAVPEVLRVQYGHVPNTNAREEQSWPSAQC